MDEVDTGQNAAPAVPERAGDILRNSRESQGLSVADIAARTRVPLRHLEAIEASDYSALPSSTYAVGFTRAYARAVGVDEVRIAQMVRDDVAKLGRRTPEYEPYEMTDPSRVPSRGIAIVALGIAIAVLVLVGAIFLAADPELYRRGLVKLVPPKAEGVARKAVDDAAGGLRGWMKGEAVAIVVVAVLTGTGLWLLGVPAAIGLGLIAGLLDIVPFVGPIIAGVPAVMLAFTQSPSTALWTTEPSMRQASVAAIAKTAPRKTLKSPSMPAAKRSIRSAWNR